MCSVSMMAGRMPTSLVESDGPAMPHRRRSAIRKVAALAAKHKVEVETFLRHTFLDVEALVASPGFKPPTNNNRVETMVCVSLPHRTASLPDLFRG